MKKHFNFILVSVFVFSFLIRVIGIDRFPNGFTQDEAGLGYDAYSLLKTGKDEWGVTLPVTLRSFGDFKLPLYSYLVVPSVFVFGLNEFAVRFPNAVFGAFAVIAVYLMVFKLTENKKLAMLSAVFLSISPWHFSLSRGAFEANLTTFFIPAGIWAFLRGLRNHKYMVLSVLLFGLNLFTYHSARIFTPFVILLLILSYGKDLIPELRNHTGKKWFYLSGLILSFFFASAFFSNLSSSLTRPLDVTILNPTDGWQAVSDRRFEAVWVGLPDKIARIFSNKLIYIADLFFSNYLSYFSLNFLFTQGAGEWTYGMIPGHGVLFIFEIFFLVAFFVELSRGNIKSLRLILFWFLLAPIPAALSKGPGFAANRAALMMPAIQIISAQGALSLYYLLRGIQNKVIVKMIFVVFFFFAAFKILSFFENYTYHAPRHQAAAMHYGIKDSIKYVAGISGDYDRVFISRSLSVPNIWVAFYTGWDPRDYQNETVDWLRYQEKSKYLDQLEGYSLGKYTFGSINYDLKNQNVLILGRSEDFKYGIKTLKVFNYPDDTPAYFVVESKEL